MLMTHRHDGAALKKCRGSMAGAPGKVFLALFFWGTVDFC
jgi:hypothetical protein